MTRLRIRRSKPKVADEDLTTQLVACKERNKRLRKQYNDGIALYNDLLEKLVSLGVAEKTEDGGVTVRQNVSGGVSEEQIREIARDVAERAVGDRDVETPTPSAADMHRLTIVELYDVATTGFTFKVVFNWIMRNLGKLAMAVILIIFFQLQVPV